jgi:hypothetical protein
MMQNENDDPHPPPEEHDDHPFEAFEDLTKRLLKVPKTEVDEKRRAESRKAV